MKTSKHHSTSSTSANLFSLVLFTALGLAGVLILRSNLAEQTEKVATESLTPLQTIIQPNAFFYSAAVPNPNLAQVSIEYQPQGEPHVVYLQLDVQSDAELVSRMVSHPLFSEITWPTVSNNQLSLYQRLDTHESLDAFLQNPPQDYVILADPAVLIHPQFEHLQAKPLNEQATLEGIDYILTTYKPPQSVNDRLRYQTLIDISSARINDINEYVWQIIIPTATEAHPFYLGGVEVDYQ